MKDLLLGKTGKSQELMKRWEDIPSFKTAINSLRFVQLVEEITEMAQKEDFEQSQVIIEELQLIMNEAELSGLRNPEKYIEELERIKKKYSSTSETEPAKAE